MSRYSRRRKYCRFTAEGIEEIDYKDLTLLKVLVRKRITRDNCRARSNVPGSWHCCRTRIGTDQNVSGTRRVQPIAAWLVARPQNGVLGLAGTLLLPLAPIVSGLVMVHLVFRHGLRTSVLQGLVAAAVLSTVALIMGAPIGQILLNAASTWLPGMLLAGLIRSQRSLTLALQVSVIVAIVVTLAFFVILGDPAVYWNEVITALAKLFEENHRSANDDDFRVPQLVALCVGRVARLCAFSKPARAKSSFRAVL